MGKITELLIFIISPLVAIWWFLFSLSSNNVLENCNLGRTVCNESYAYYQGYVIGIFLWPIIITGLWIGLGLYLRRRRIKKEKQQVF